jgi:large subunit ribosomal protein L33
MSSIGRNLRPLASTPCDRTNCDAFLSQALLLAWNDVKHAVVLTFVLPTLRSGQHEFTGIIMAKATTIKVKLVSSADTGYYYVTKKNARTMTDKLTKKKYDPVAKKHVEFREAKIK